MRLTTPRRLLVLGITAPALLAGGLVAAGASNAAPSAGAAPAVTSAAALRLAKLPKRCKPGRGDYRVGTTRIFNKRRAVVGHVSLYRRVHTRYICIVTFRDGAARRNAETTRAHFVSAKRAGYTQAVSAVRSRPLLTKVRAKERSFVWYGSLKHNGVWYKSAKKRAPRDFPSNV